MENAAIVKIFVRYNLMIRPDALKLVKQVCSTSDEIELLCRNIQKLNLKDNIVEEAHIQQIMNRKTDDVLDVLRERMASAIIIVGPFGQQNKYNIESTPQAKINMNLRKLKRITELLRTEKHIVSLGSIIGKNYVISKSMNLLGILFQQTNQQYSITDGLVSISLIINDCKAEGLINVGHVVIVQGTWNEQENSLNVTFIGQPISKIQRPEAKNDLQYNLESDTFGSFKKTYELMSHFSTEPTFSRQKALEYFLAEKLTTFSLWFLSDFSMMKTNSLARLEKLLDQTQQHKDEMLMPKALFFMGQFFESVRDMKASQSFAQEFMQLLNRYPFLEKMLIFFVPSYNDPFNPHSLPHPPFPLELILPNAPQNFHSVCNPVRLECFGTKVQIARVDAARDMRKHHIFPKEQYTTEEFVESLWAQRYLGTTSSICKWDHAHSLDIPDTTDVLILGDATIHQFVIDQTGNPGNFSDKGEFLVCTVDEGRISLERCNI